MSEETRVREERGYDVTDEERKREREYHMKGERNLRRIYSLERVGFFNCLGTRSAYREQWGET